MTGRFAPPVAAETAAGLATVEYLTIPNVEIATVGMRWKASTGEVTLTLQHLADAVQAENYDPHILPPRLKVGHTDPRFNEDPPVWDAFAYHGPLREDGNPVYGKVANLRLANDGAVIVGDYVEMPDWLATAAPSAYPSRSQEADWNIVTPGGKTYSMVITAVALLGEPLPAVEDLEDLVRELTGGPAAVAARKRTPVTARRDDMPDPVAATASVNVVEETFWNDFAIDDKWFWWPREFWVDTGQLIVDDNEGHLYRVPFSTDADGNVTFNDPVRGILDFRDLPPVSASVSQSAPDRVYPTAAAARPKDRVRAATTTEGGNNVEAAQLRESLGLPEDATDEQVAAKQAELAAAESDDDTDTDDAGEKPPVAAQTVTVSKEIWEQTQSRLARLEETDQTRMTRENKSRRDSEVGNAVAAGQIAATEYDHYRGLMEIDEEKTTKLLRSLAAGRIPIAERGKAPSAQATATDLEWWPQFTTTTRKEQ